MPVDHYENFPVASWLLPARLRAPIEAIYGFARGADDIADEGNLTDAERLAGLARYERALEAIEGGRDPEPEFARIATAIREWHLPIELLRDLLDAFRQDVTTKRYASYALLLDYCRRSANPVGRLVLHVFGRIGDAAQFPRSDAICTSLQLINFWQDVALDWRKGRVYIPREDLERFEVSEEQIGEGRADDRWRRLMAFECARTRELLATGAPLGALLPGRLGIEIRATIEGGARILDKIEAVGGDVFRHRPTLGAADAVAIVVRALARTSRFGPHPAPPRNGRP